MYESNTFRDYIYANLSPAYRLSKISVNPRQVTSGSRKIVVVVASAVKSVIRVVSGRLLGKYPLTFDDRIKEAQMELAKMSVAEKWELVKKSYGMWEDYPEDWLERIRKGTFTPNRYIASTDTKKCLT